MTLALFVCALPLPARAEVRELQSGVAGLPRLTPNEMASLIDPRLFADATGFYDVPASFASPYSAGTVQQAHLSSGLARLNALRRLAGLQAVTLDASLTELAQAASYLGAANGEISHFPKMPQGMDSAIYRKGFTGAGSSNLAVSSFIPSCGPLAYCVDQWMNDSDPSGVDRLRHRRWQLNPVMDKTGFGASLSPDTGFLYAAEYSVSSAGPRQDYDFISWPASGSFPAGGDVFGPDFAWSISLNTQKYQRPSEDGISVTLTREADGATWVFDGSKEYSTQDGEYFNVDNSGYGLNNAIIFRPDGIDKYDGSYTVTVSGVKYLSGGEADFKFTVDFFDPDLLPKSPEPPFTDVSEGEWYYPYVSSAYSAGLILGTGDGKFSPDMTLSVAQVMTFAARTLARSRGEDDPVGEDWRAGSYSYCLENGLIDPELYPLSDVDRPASRFDLVRIMDGAIPASAMAERVTVKDGGIPDVRESDPLGPAIYRWYRAGILEGAGGGRFQGEDGMVRSAMAAVLCRMNGLA